MSSPAEYLRSVVEAFNQADWDRSLELAQGATYNEPATGRTVQAADLVGLLKGWKAAFPDITGEIRSMTENGETAAAEITWSGTHTGPFPRVDGTVIPPSNSPVSNDAAMVVHFDGDEPVRTNHYFDVLNLLRQMGAV